MVKVHQIRLGFTNCYILEGLDIIMVDGGPPGKIDSFVKHLNALDIIPEAIKLLIATHGHIDHIGTAADIKKLTGAEIAIHESERDYIEKGTVSIPPGVNFWGSFLVKLIKVLSSDFQCHNTEVDIVLDSNDFNLSAYGVPGKVIHTPGHSKGSVSILLDTGEAFVGDLVMNAFPLTLRPGPPVFAEDIFQAQASLTALINKGAEILYPSHGQPFPARKIYRNLKFR
ncbi:MAG: MBL fold metallo-hydrolase [Desulfurivibrionaceae bacterium]